MKFDAQIAPTDLSEVSALAKSAESDGIDGLWTSETQHDPFLALPLIAEHTTKIQFGTGVAIAFARSPASMAYTAWDLAAASGGRFVLGLGTQVKPHIERRFGMRWPDSPVDGFRDYINAIRALWRSWQEGEKLNYRTERYKLTLMTPFFNPGPIEFPDIPIYIAGVNSGMARLAGEVADGFHAHVYHSPEYLEQVIRPAIEQGSERADKSAKETVLATSVFTVTSEEEAEFVRGQLAFYASTPTYRTVMAFHGWESMADQLQALARRQQWPQMAELVTDQVLETFAVVAPSDQLGQALRSRYSGLVDRLAIYRPYSPQGGFKELAGALR